MHLNSVCGLDGGDHVCDMGHGQRPTRAEFQRAHGTPREFREACLRAADDGFVTYLEARTAADKYEREWCNADNGSSVP
jgi:hypothetical protein